MAATGRDRALHFTVKDKNDKAVKNFTAITEELAKQHCRDAGYKLKTLKQVESK